MPVSISPLTSQPASESDWPRLKESISWAQDQDDKSIKRESWIPSNIFSLDKTGRRDAADYLTTSSTWFSRVMSRSGL